jgi:hypothetical protein
MNAGSPAPRREDPLLGPVRRCSLDGEWWPEDPAFWTYRPDGRIHGSQCRACRNDRRRRRPVPRKMTTHGSEPNKERKRQMDKDRKRALRQDPVLGEKLRARQREAQRRYYERHRLEVLEQHRERYAAKLDRPVRIGFGRPRVEA